MTFTTSELIRSYQARSGLPRRQVLLLVARCGIVRYLSLNHFNRFVLKGGGLMYHVYGAGRVSFVDTDLADTETIVGDPGALGELMTIRSESGFELTTSPEGQWIDKGDIIKGQQLTFTLADLSVDDRPNSGKVNVSVSFRRSERMIEPVEPLFFDSEGLLSDNEPFQVNGLVLDEVAAEKILAWCVKRRPVQAPRRPGAACARFQQRAPRGPRP